MKTNKYEALYIVASTLTDPEVQVIADKFKEAVEKNGGTVESAKKWDKRRLAYEIDGHREGNYIIMLFEAETSVPQELSRLMRISDDVIRHRIFLRDEVEEA
jgi:small subunit ribosomal protein S6